VHEMHTISSVHLPNTAPRMCYFLMDAGIQQLSQQLATSESRAALMKTDALCYAGRDLFGNEFKVPDCFRQLRDTFELHIDYLDTLPHVPLPTYKRTPLGRVIGEMFDCRLEFKSLIDSSEMAAAATLARQVDAVRLAADELPGVTLPAELPVKDDTESQVSSAPEYFSWGGFHVEHDSEESIRTQYFGWQENEEDEEALQCELKVEEEGCDTPRPYLQCGWLDGVGVTATGISQHDLPTELLHWETAPQILAFDHVPIRAQIAIRVMLPPDEQAR